MQTRHVPVLLEEVLNYLNPQPGQNFIDGTLGGGGHTFEILKRTAPNGKVLAFDLDDAAIARVRVEAEKRGVSERLVTVQSSFAELDVQARANGFSSVAGIILDLGLSSDQLESEHGFSFQTDAPLDMRFNRRTNMLTAQEVLNTYDEQALVSIFKNFGEEPSAKRLARAIIRNRSEKPFTTTTDLVAVVRQVNRGIRIIEAVLARVFQAVRIEVNAELESLERVLPQAVTLLSPRARLAVISFHSLEDRIVKTFFRQSARGCICPPSYPVCRCGLKPTLSVLTAKPLVATSEEVHENARSRSAKLRVAEKLP